MTSSDTIYALSSGGLPSGVAVVRLSGSESLEVLRALCVNVPSERRMAVRALRDPGTGELIDQAMVCWFQQPVSFTGEDVVELHMHGGLAVLSKVYEVLRRFEGLRMAEAGEFSRRAFENGKLDLTEAEGLADLIASETESQRQLALSQANGGLREKLEAWRGKIVRMRAFIEAEFDFSDEEDVPDSMLATVQQQAKELIGEIANDLAMSATGEIIRDGFRVALMGPPNAGKSSLLNALAKRDVAIVTDTPGTTRDLIEVRLDLGGIPVIVTDTAGIRETSNVVEALGIDRALGSARGSHLIVWLTPSDYPTDIPEEVSGIGRRAVEVISKNDLQKPPGDCSSVSVNTIAVDGIAELVALISKEASSHVKNLNGAFFNRERHKVEVGACLREITSGEKLLDMDMTVASEHFRLAGDHIGRLTGRVDVEDLLDVIFSEFCVGK